jgi:outer membrane biosynthesis protein TonB
VTFVVVVVAALLAVFPTTAALGFLVCLLAIVPAIIAFRRTRKGTATNHGRSFATVLMAPVFLVVGIVMAPAAAPQVEPASDATALAAPAPVPAPAPVAPVAPAPLLAAPVPAAAPVDQAPAVVPPTVRKAPPTSVHAAPAQPSTHVAEQVVAPPAPKPAAAPAPKPAPAPVAKPAPAPKPAPVAAAKPAPAAKPATASSACNESTSYVNVDGDCVHRPTNSGGSSGATARCNDGSVSYSENHRGTCSGHKGVAQWL